MDFSLDLTICEMKIHLFFIIITYSKSQHMAGKKGRAWPMAPLIYGGCKINTKGKLKRLIAGYNKNHF